MLVHWDSADLILFLFSIFEGLEEMSLQMYAYLNKPVLPFLDVTIIDAILGPGFFIFLGYALVVWLIP